MSSQPVMSDCIDKQTFRKIMVETELKRLRKGKRGRPYQPIKHYSRDELNEMRDVKLKSVLIEMIKN